MAELIARGQTVHFGSIGAASLDIVPLLALEMLGLDVAVLLGLNSRNAARAGLVGGEFDVDYQTSPGYLAQVRPLAEVGQVVPLMSLGAMDRHGRLARDPAFPALPSFPEVYRQVHGRDPQGAEWQAWQALFRAGFAAQKMVFLPRSVPDARADVFRAAFAQMAADPGLLDHGHQRLFRSLARLEEAREATALPQLRHPQVQRAQTGIESALSIPVPPGGPLAAAFMPTGADDAFHIGLHDQLQHRLGDAAQKVALIVLGQKLGQVHVRLGHRGLRMVRG